MYDDDANQFLNGIKVCIGGLSSNQEYFYVLRDDSGDKACTYGSGSNGAFTITDVLSADVTNNDGTSADYVGVIYFEDENTVKIVNWAINNEDAHQYDVDDVKIDGGFSGYVNLGVVNVEEDGKHFYTLYNTVNEIYDTGRTYTSGLDKVELFFGLGCDWAPYGTYTDLAGILVDCNGTTTYFSSDPRIFLDDELYDADFVTAHEYGHFVHDEIGESGLGSLGDSQDSTKFCGVSRFTDSTCSVSILNEAFAEFFSLVHLNSGKVIMDLVHDPSLFTYDYLDYENRNYHNADGTPGTFPSTTFTSRVDVTAALWDIADGTGELDPLDTDKKDNLSYGYNEVIDEMDTFDSIYEYRTNWELTNNDLNHVYYLNDVDNTFHDNTPVVRNTSFTDDFEGDLSNWTLSGNNDWESDDPEEDIPLSDPNNDVLTSGNCDTICQIVMKEGIDISDYDHAVLSFDRFVASDMDGVEGLYVAASSDGGNTWVSLETFTDDNGKNTDIWEYESYNLSNYVTIPNSDNFVIQLTAISTKSGEKAEIDNFSITGSVDVDDPPDTVPDTPTLLTATTISETSIDLSWNTPSNNGGRTITGYYIERNLNDAGFIDFVANTGSASVSYTDSSLSQDDTAKYRVSAINGVGTSTPSNIATATTNIISKDIDSSTGSGLITVLTDKGVLSNATSIDESTLPTVGKPPVSFPHGLFSWNVTGLNNGDTITVSIALPSNVPADSKFWKVMDDVWVNATSILGSNDGDDTITLTLTDGGAYDADGQADGKIVDPGGIAILNTVPDSPTNLSATAINATSIDLSWNAPENNGGSDITGYMIERNLNDSAFAKLENTTSVKYTDNTLSKNDNATYRVSATNVIGTSTPSNEAEATTTTPKAIFKFTGTVRDLKESHPNMGEGCTSNGCNAIFPGIVGDIGSPLGDDGTPIFANTTRIRADQTLTTPEDFYSWFHTVNEISMAQPITLNLTQSVIDPKIYTFDSGYGYFPIDNQLFKEHRNSHNYYFTVQLHSTFVFDDPIDSPNQSFTFSGDDDVWVFVDEKLILDVGGVHAKQTATFTASQLMAEPFNLLPKTIYNFDFFFAERQCCGSNFRIDTSINFDPSFTLGTNGSSSGGNFEQKVIDIGTFKVPERSNNSTSIYETGDAMTVENAVMKIEFPADLLIIKDISNDDGNSINNDAIEITESTRVVDPDVVSGTIQSLIEVGDQMHRIDFNKAIKVTLFGQVGNSAFYIDSDNVTHLIQECSELADSDVATTYLNANSLGECYHDSNSDLVIWTTHFTGFGSSSDSNAGDSNEKSNGNDNLWKTKPTFGISHTTNNPVVECGFSWDGICYDITDNWHTPFEKVDLITGKNYSATLKTYMQHPPLFMEIALVPELEQYYNSETKIEIIFDGVVNSYYGNYDADTTANDVPSIKSVSVIQKENIIDESILEATIHKVSCGFVEQDCYELQLDNIMFRDIPFFEKIGIQAVDTQRRTQITYLNEGFAFSGESLNPSKTVNIHHHSKTGLFEVVQLDKFDNLWSDEDGIIYTHNDVNTWMRLSPYDFERHQDLETSVMTRMHSEFESLVDTQRQIAEQTFAEKFGDYADDSVLTFTPMDITKHYDVIDRNSDAFEQSVLLQREIAQVYLDSLSTAD